MTQWMNDQQLEDLIVSKIVQLGCACAPDLAGQIGGGISPHDLVPLLESLVERDILRHKIQADDPRMYNGYQTIYELAR